MREKLKGLDYKKLIRIVFLMLVAMRMCCKLFYTTEHEFQIYRDIDLYKAMIYLMLIAAVYRGITLRDVKAWIFAVVGAVSIFAYLKINTITVDTYGPVGLEAVIYRSIMQVMFIGLMLDLIRHKPYKITAYIKNPAFILYVIFIFVFAITNITSVIPFVCPMAVLLLTRFSDEEKKEFSYILAFSTYYAFTRIFTKCLVFFPDVYEGGRYLGGLWGAGSSGASCACALAACVYAFILFRNKKKKAGMIAASILAIYPIVGILMFQSRTVYFGIFLMLLSVWVFVHGKGMKVTLKRFLISLCVIAAMPLALWGLSKVLLMLVTNGTVDASNLNYFWAHILAMQTATKNEDMIFEPGTFLFAFDALTSTRISIFAEKITHIRLTGFNEYSRIGFNSHNLFIANLIRYGLIGGVPFIGWFICNIYKAAKTVKRNCYSTFVILLFLLMTGVYSSISLYISSLGGVLLLIIQVFNISGDESELIMGETISEDKYLR